MVTEQSVINIKHEQNSNTGSSNCGDVMNNSLNGNRNTSNKNTGNIINSNVYRIATSITARTPTVAMPIATVETLSTLT